MTRPLFKFLMAFGICFAVNAKAQIVNPAEFARAFNYPLEKLRVRDVTEATQKQSADVIAAVVLDSTDNSFAPTTVVVGKQGLLLSDRLRARLTQAFEEQSKQGTSSITKLQLPNGADGFIGTGAFGPGGQEEMAVANIPTHGVDVQIKVSVPHETPLDVTEATQAYHDALTNTDGFLAAAMEASVRAVVGRVLQSGPPLKAQAPPAKAEPPTLASATPVPSTTPAASPQPATPVAETPAVVVERKSPAWPWVVGILALIVIVVLALKRRT